MANKTLSAAAIFAAATMMAWPGAASAEDIVLGASVQLTGPSANTGRYYKDAYEFTVDKINEAGGIDVGGEKHKLARF